jgi:hypothetical protein
MARWPASLQSRTSARLHDKVEVPSKKKILLAQQSAVNEYERYQQVNAPDRREGPPQHVDAGGMRMVNNALLILARAVELKQHLCLRAHFHSAGHRAYEAKLGAIKEYVAWTTMTKDVKVFVQNCLHCVATIPGDKGPRLLGPQLHATKPKEILHLEFLYIGLSRDEKYQYLLLLKDDLSGYIWLVPCRTADAAATVLCASKDETSVEIMGRMFRCNFLRNSRL